MSTPASLPRSNSARTSAYEPDRDPGGQQALFERFPTADSSWKAELNARLREHRQRRADAGMEAPADRLEPYGAGHGESRSSASAASAVAARVAARYREAPSYQELHQQLLLASAAAAETAAVAAREAHAVVEAAFAEWAPSDPFADAFFTESRPRPMVEEQPTFDGGVPCAVEGPLASAVWPVAVAAIEHHVPLPERTPVPARPAIGQRARTLVDAFAEAVVPAAQSLPAKLIEFPRELIAPRKQRPRLAEGPLAEDGEQGQESSGMALRIFEVAAADAAGQETRAGLAGSSRQDEAPERTIGGYGVSENPEESNPSRRRRSGFAFGAEESSRPEPRQESLGWGAIRLGEHPKSEPPSENQRETQPRRETRAAVQPGQGYRQELAPALHDLAPIGNRLMAALVDGGLVFGCFLAAVLVFASCTVHVPAGKAALVAAGLAFGVLATFYGWLFMSFGGGSTPGMRYARIALCTFADENPTRKDLQGRVPATALALLPLGLGVFWAILDEDKLGWHDRMTRTYQRSYR